MGPINMTLGNRSDCNRGISVVQTRDGSWTCFNAGVHEHYHNLHGAYTEAKNLYAMPTKLAERLQQKPHIVVLDPFLGLGYNTLACMAQFAALQTHAFPNARLTILAFESDPQILAQMPQILEQSPLDDLKSFLPAFAHNTYYRTQRELLNFIQDRENGQGSPLDVAMVIGDTRQWLPLMPDDSVDVIYHDPFSPKKQPELWTRQLFIHYHRILIPEIGAVFTYSAAAAVRCGLHEAGFFVGPLVSQHCKQGTVAFMQTPQDMPLFSSLEMALMQSKSGIPYEDSNDLSLDREAIVYQRQAQQASSSLPSTSAIHRQFKNQNNP